MSLQTELPVHIGLMNICFYSSNLTYTKLLN
jgi:hypothetical protein